MQACGWRAHSTFTNFYLWDLTVYSDDLLKLGPLVVAQKRVLWASSLSRRRKVLVGVVVILHFDIALSIKVVWWMLGLSCRVFPPSLYSTLHLSVICVA